MKTTQNGRALFGAVEAGGTKVNLAVGYSATDIVATGRVMTESPAITIAAMLEFFEAFREDLVAFGVASFGPVRLDRRRADWGKLLGTPKQGWSGASFVEPLISGFGLPTELETDVGAAAIAEHRLGSLQGVDSGVYLTVGTGVGGGLLSNGQPIRGAMHPEVGHIRVLRLLASDDAFPGCCPFHGDCLEGLAAGPAILQRWGDSLSELPQDHVAHDLVTDYLGQACATLALTFSAERIVIGGGVSHSPGLHAAVAVRARHWLAGYLGSDHVGRANFIVPPALEDRAGLVGATLLALRAKGVRQL